MQLELILLTVAGSGSLVMAAVVSLCMAAQRGDARAQEMAATLPRRWVAVRRLRPAAGTPGPRGSARISRLPVRAFRRGNRLDPAAELSLSWT